MAVIAVAGGAGRIGRTIVEVLKNDPKHKVIVLGRKAPDVTDPAAPVVTVDYDDIDGTAKVLAEAGVEAVISAISVMAQPAADAQVNLIKSAAKSPTIKRFIASEWGTEHTPESHAYALRHAAYSELRNTDLEWTRFDIGWILDFYAPRSLNSYMMGVPFALDVANKTAGIPGTGDESMTFTYSFDVAKFVAASLELPKWEEITYCYGDKTTWNQVLKMAEEARGSKFTVTYDPLEKLEKGEVTELPSHPRVYSMFPKPALQRFLSLFGRYVIDGKFNSPADKALNAIFPDIKPMTVKDVMELWKDQ